MEDLTGKQLNQYQIVAPLGEGGMASVYKAFQPAMERYVALKVLPRQLAMDPQFVGRFEQEAKVIASLQHPHILPVFDSGEAEGYTFIVMPFVETGTLSDLMLGQPLHLDQIRKITSQVGDALDYAHSRGIVHRDIKPSNILMDERGNCLLADFGIAKIVEGTSQFTQTGGLVGTPAYMSPEQGTGTKPDGRSDIYSFGVILFEMATGRPPYRAETPMAVVIKHIHDPLPLPHSINPQISDGLERIILKALAKNRQDRYQSCTELVRAVQSLGDSELYIPLPAAPTSATLVDNTAAKLDADDEVPALAAVSPFHQQIGPPDPTRQRLRWMPWMFVGAVVIGFGLIAIIVVWFLLNSLINGPDDLSVSEQVLQTRTASQTQENIVLPLTTQTEISIPTLSAIVETSTPIEVPTSTPQPSEPVLGIGDTLNSLVDGSVMIFILAGEFIMGAAVDDPNADPDEFPQTTIYVDAFWIDQFEVTNRQYQSCVKAGECTPPRNSESATRFVYYGSAEFDNYPVINVTWFDANTYCQWRDARLPTEAEWEKAARGIEGFIYPWGNTFEVNHSNYCASSILCPDEPPDGFEDTAPTGSFIAGASSYGVHDMAGNVNEWVADWYDEKYYDRLPDGIENPQGPESGEKRGIRGGSSALNATKLRTTNRGSAIPTQYGFYDGFRCAQTP